MTRDDLWMTRDDRDDLPSSCTASFQALSVNAFR